MEKKRWIAVGIAAALFVTSGISSMMANNQQKDEQETARLNEINSLLYGTGQLEEHVLEPGEASKKIVRLEVNGTIQDTDSTSLFSSTDAYNHQAFLKQLQQIKDDPTVKGILLEVNSPGGGVYESAQVAKKLEELQKDRKIPIYVSMESMAASGGYYISAKADKIFATSETTTGSIGVIMQSSNYTELYKKLGIEDTTVKSGAMKDIGSSSRPRTEEEQKVLQEYIDSSYGRFVKIVSEGRDMPEDEVRKLADGRIYDGEQALENHLVDKIGYPEDALKALRKDHNLKDAEYVTYSTDSTGFMNTFLGSKLAEMQGIKDTDTSALLKLLSTYGTADTPRTMYMYGGE